MKLTRNTQKNAKATQVKVSAIASDFSFLKKSHHEHFYVLFQPSVNVKSKQDQKNDEQDCSDFELLGKLDIDQIDDQFDVEKKKTVKKSIKFRSKNTVEKRSPRVTRSVRKCYKEEEVPDDDHYICMYREKFGSLKITDKSFIIFCCLFLVCEECQDFYYGECPSHSFKIIEDKDNKVDTEQSDAMQSLPENLCIKKSSIPQAGLGVFSKEKLEMRTRFGPYKGKKMSPEDLDDDINTSYMWEVSVSSTIFLNLFFTWYSILNFRLSKIERSSIMLMVRTLLVVIG